MGADTNRSKSLCTTNCRLARRLWRELLDPEKMRTLREISVSLRVSIGMGDLKLMAGGWYVTHTGLIGIAKRRRSVTVSSCHRPPSGPIGGSKCLVGITPA